MIVLYKKILPLHSLQLKINRLKPGTLLHNYVYAPSKNYRYTGSLPNNEHSFTIYFHLHLRKDRGIIPQKEKM